MKLVAVAITLTIAAPVAQATTYIVRPDGGGDFPTIQAAADFAVDGDTILLANGSFVGDGNRDVDFLGKAITIASQGNDPGRCVVDCGGTVDEPHNAFLFQSGEGSASVLQAIKIANGYAPRGGGVLCHESSPTLRRIIFQDNSAEEGGGVHCRSASPVIELCTFLQNATVNDGGGILCGSEFGDNSSPTIRDCIFTENDARSGGAIHCAYSYPAIRNCTFRENTAVSGGALSCYLANPEVSGCLFTTNSATVGGAVWCEMSSGPVFTSCTFGMNEAFSRAAGVYSKDSVPTLRNTIIAWSVAGEAVYSREGPLVPELTCCNLWANRGGDWIGVIEDQRSVNGNINADPIFCDRWRGDYTISAASACAPSQSVTCGLIGAYGVACTEVPAERVTWGRIRSTFR